MLDDHYSALAHQGSAVFASGFRGANRSLVDESFILIQSAHLQKPHSEKLSAEERDLPRADMVRDRLKPVSRPIAAPPPLGAELDKEEKYCTCTIVMGQKPERKTPRTTHGARQPGKAPHQHCKLPETNNLRSSPLRNIGTSLGGFETKTNPSLGKQAGADKIGLLEKPDLRSRCERYFCGENLQGMGRLRKRIPCTMRKRVA